MGFIRLNNILASLFLREDANYIENSERGYEKKYQKNRNDKQQIF